jgi:hypothetical protein
LTLSRQRVLLAAFVLSAGAAAAWQTAVSAVGWSDAQLESIAHNFFTASGPANLPNGGSMSAETKKRWIGRAPAERAQAIRDLSLHAKRYVQTPAFENLYNGWIKDRYDAVNHGIKADRNAPAAGDDMNSAMSAAASEMVKAFAEMPPEGMRMLLTHDIDSLKNSGNDKDRKMLARYREVETLTKTNPAEARKRYAMVKAMALSGETDEGKLQANLAAGAKSSAERKRVEQQRAWDEHNLKAELRRRLTDFIALASSVDFNAKTEPRARREMFANPEFERKPGAWKTLYRLGKEPTSVAVAVAQQWLREL